MCTFRQPGRRAASVLALACCLAAIQAGCTWFTPPAAAPTPADPIPAEASQSAPDRNSLAGVEADAGVTAVAGESSIISNPRGRKSLVLAVLHLQVPEKHVAEMDRVWRQLREDVFDAETQLRLRENGLRVGVGHVDFWSAIRESTESIPEQRVAQASPVRVPLGFPISYEMDAEPHDQTLFFVGRDGVLSGGTWPESRNVLRFAYAADPQYVERIRMAVRPEVHQQEDGVKWVRTPEGIWQTPRQSVVSFDAAEFVISLRPQEFVLMATSDAAHVYGILGRAFLTSDIEGTRYRSYLFLRPDVTDVGQRN